MEDQCQARLPTAREPVYIWRPVCRDRAGDGCSRSRPVTSTASRSLRARSGFCFPRAVLSAGLALITESEIESGRQFGWNDPPCRVGVLLPGGEVLEVSRAICAVSSPVSRHAASASRAASSAVGTADCSCAEGTPGTAGTTGNDHHSGQPINNPALACRRPPPGRHHARPSRRAQARCDSQR